MEEKNLAYIKKYLSEDRLEEGIALLKKGVSPQYIVGNIDFYGNMIQVDSRVLIPRFETELLVERTIHYIKDIFGNEHLSDLNILDIGTGSGCISIALKKELNSHIVGVDISQDALEVARSNASDNEVDISFICSDIFSNVHGMFDVIISNPPYIRFDEQIEEIVKDNEPHLALYAEENGLYFYRKILGEANRYLKNKFLIAFEIGYTQGNKVSNLAYKYLGENINVSVEKDYSYRDRFVFIWNVY